VGGPETGLGDGSEYSGWRHVALTYEAATKRLKLYVNPWDDKPDKEITVTSLSGNGFGYEPNASKPLRIAAGQFEGNPPTPTPAGFFKGLIDEVALYGAAVGGDRLRVHMLAAITP
jgi:hypothetical protein